MTMMANITIKFAKPQQFKGHLWCRKRSDHCFLLIPRLVALTLQKFNQGRARNEFLSVSRAQVKSSTVDANCLTVQEFE